MTDSMQKISNKELTLGEKLGEGGFGVVYKGKWQGEKVAIKTLRMTKLSATLEKEFVNEAAAMATLNSPRVIHLFGICTEPGHYAMVMALMPKGDLYGLLSDKNRILEWKKRWQLAIDVGTGLSYLHGKGILHRDLKSLNILLDRDERAKITDFGLAKLRQHSKSIYTDRMRGSIPWMAPELFGRRAKVTEKADVYAYGMVLWEIASRNIPFSDAYDPNLISIWVKGGEREAVPEGCPKGYAEVMKLCWKGEMEDRPTALVAVQRLQQVKPGKQAKVAGKADYKKGYALYLKCRYRDALPLLTKAAEMGYPPAYLRLERIYRHGEDTGVPKDTTIAEKWKKKAAEAIAWFKQQVKSENAYAQFNLGVCYEYGTGVAKDEEMAVKYYTKAADQGHANAQFNLGWYYRSGVGGVKKDMKMMERLFKLAAEQGHVGAQHNLGFWYEEGIGLVRDEKTAVKYYRMAAKQGYARAQYGLAACCENGRGVTKDEKTAINLYKLAAKQGHDLAKQCLFFQGRLYEYGRSGVEKDIKRAVEFYKLAGHYGKVDLRRLGYG